MPASSFKIKVCLVGEAAVGKTSLVRRFVLDEFDDSYTSTLGAKTTKAEIEIADPRGGGIVGVSMLIWDIMGDRQVPQRLLDAYFQGSQGVIGVCDVLRPSTIGGLQDWVQSVYRVVGPIPTVYAANKADLLNGGEVPSGGPDLSAMLSSLSAPHLLTSAKTGANVQEVFSLLAQAIIGQAKIADSAD